MTSRWTYKGEVLSYGSVADVVSFGGEVYAGTYSFDMSLAGVFRDDGGVWTNIGTFREYEAVGKFLEFGGDLYVGTSTSNMGGTFYARVYKYMGGTTWTQVGTDIGTNESIYSMCIFDGKIHIGTGYSGHVYRLDGASWTDLGRIDTETIICSLVDFGGDLFAGCSNGKVYKLVTGSWVAQSGDSVGSRLLVHNGELYSCHDGTYLLVYKYNGPSDWTLIGTFVSGSYGELASDGTDLYIGGNFGYDPWPIKFFKYVGTPENWEIVGSFDTYDSLYGFKSWDGLLWAGIDKTVWSYDGADLFSKRRVPTSDFSVQWTPSAGNNYANVDEYPAVNDSDYNTQASTPMEDIFGFAPFDVPVGTIENVTVYVRGYKISTGIVAGGLYVGGTWYPATLIPFHEGVPVDFFPFIWSTNPATGLAWTVNDVNGIGSKPLTYFGYKGSGTFNRVARLYIVVNYNSTPPPPPPGPTNDELMRHLKWFDSSGVFRGCWLGDNEE